MPCAVDLQSLALLTCLCDARRQGRSHDYVTGMRHVGVASLRACAGPRLRLSYSYLSCSSSLAGHRYLVTASPDAARYLDSTITLPTLHASL